MILRIAVVGTEVTYVCMIPLGFVNRVCQEGQVTRLAVKVRKDDCLRSLQSCKYSNTVDTKTKMAAP